jgi:quercetin dioxygenase-like cupin family protein
MKIEGVPFVTVDWNNIEPTVHKGDTGQALWRTFEQGNIRVRMVEYSPGYRADHWCARGHVLLVLDGRLTTELKDGRVFELLPGMSYHAEDDDKNPHRSWTSVGARLFIVD